MNQVHPTHFKKEKKHWVLFVVIGIIVCVVIVLLLMNVADTQLGNFIEDAF